MRHLIKLFACQSLFAALALTAPISYSVYADTQAFMGTTGSLDFQFNPGPLGAQPAVVTLNVFSGPFGSGAATATGDVTGQLPPSVAIGNSTGFNDYFREYTFGPFVSFTVTFSGPAVDSPLPGFPSGSTFAFALFSDAAGTVPLLTGQFADPNGFAALIDLTPNGGTYVTTFQPGDAKVNQIPEPAPWLMLSAGLAVVAARRFKILLALIAAACLAQEPPYQISVVASSFANGVQSGPDLGTPALDFYEGKWQVAYSTRCQSSAPWAIRLHTIGNPIPRTVFAGGGVAPGQPSWTIFCDGGAPISLENGTLAFIGDSFSGSGVYAVTGTSPAVRIADSTMPVPGSSGELFTQFSSVANQGPKVIFRTDSGIYVGTGQTGPAAVVNQSTVISPLALWGPSPPPQLQQGTFTFFSIFPSFEVIETDIAVAPGWARCGGYCELIAFSGSVSAGSFTNIRGEFATGEGLASIAGTPFFTYANSPKHFPYNATNLGSPSVDSAGGIVFAGNGQIYAGDPRGFQPLPFAGNPSGPPDLPNLSAIALARKVPLEHMVAFTGGSVTGTPAVILARTGAGGAVVGTALVGESRQIQNMLVKMNILAAGAPYLAYPLGFSLFHQAVESNAVVFGTSLFGSTGHQAILLARPMAKQALMARVSSSGLVYSRVTRTFNGTVTVTNPSTQPLSGLVEVAFQNLAAGVTLTNASGYMGDTPVLLAAPDGLAPGSSVTIPVRFSNPANVVMGSTPVVYAGN